MNASELPQNLRQSALHKVLRGAKANTAAQFRAREIAPRPLVRLEDSLGETEHRLTVRGQGDGVGVAHEEPARRRRFETANVLTDRRLPHTETAPGFGEAPGLGDGHKGGQQIGVEHGSLIMFYDHTNIGDRPSQ